MSGITEIFETNMVILVGRRCMSSSTLILGHQMGLGLHVHGARLFVATYKDMELYLQ